MMCSSLWFLARYIQSPGPRLYRLLSVPRLYLLSLTPSVPSPVPRLYPFSCTDCTLPPVPTDPPGTTASPAYSNPTPLPSPEHLHICSNPPTCLSTYTTSPISTSRPTSHPTSSATPPGLALSNTPPGPTPNHTPRSATPPGSNIPGPGDSRLRSHRESAHRPPHPTPDPPGGGGALPRGHDWWERGEEMR